MVKAEIFEDNTGRIVSFRVKGHAGYAPHGEDIVCAAVSVLVQTAVLGLTHYLTTKPAIAVREGLFTCTLPQMLASEEQVRAEVILRTMYLGLAEIQQNYRRYVYVKRRRWLK